MVKKMISTAPVQEVTPEEVFFNRRHFMKSAAGLGAVAGTNVLCAPQRAPDPAVVFKNSLSRPDVFPPKRNEAYTIPKEVTQELTPRLTAGAYNNYYEFLPNGGGPVYKYTDDFKLDPWRVEVTGLCNNPMTLDLDDLFKFEHEERLYHFRCVETWAMNVPWSGFPLKKLIEKADPKSEAKFIRLVTENRPKEMPGMRQTASYYDWPYVEGLRLDEAMNDLAMGVTGAYGKPLPVQHGAPLRVIVPWKYGYKNPKSIAKIEFTKDEPKTFWQIYPHEYGFLSNVNPNIPHPRWSQARSRWLGSNEPFATPLFNGYAKYVAELYPDEPTTPQKALRRGQIAR